MRTTINSNKVYITECTAQDIAKAIKGLELLNLTVTQITIEGIFDFDTKYYRRFKEEEITQVFRECQHGITVELKDNRLYFNNMIIPDSEIRIADIQFK